MDRTGAPATARTGHGTVFRLALACAGVVALLFVGYEIAERSWLREASPGVLHALHILRGVGSSSVVGLMVGWYLLRRAPPALLHPAAPAPTPEEAIRDVAWWFVATRWVAVVAALVATLVAGPLLGALPPDNVPLLLACVGALAAANLAFGAALPRVRRPEPVLGLQMAVDLSLLTVMLHLSGGLENPLHDVYLFHVVIAAVLLRPAFAHGVAALASALLVGLALAEHSGWVPHHALAIGGAAPAQGLPVPAWMPEAGSSVLLFWVTLHFGVLVAERMRSDEAALRTSAAQIEAARRQLELVADSIGASLVLWSAPERVAWCNRIARDAASCGRGAAAALGRGEGGSPCDGCATADTIVADAFAAGADAETERRVEDDGQVRIVRVRAVPLRGGGGGVEMVLQISEDVTERRAMEAQIVHSTKMAMLGRVAAAMAHEIGNPIASMSMRLQLLEQEAPTEWVGDSARLLQQQVERVHRLVQSVRRFGRPGRQVREPCDLAETLAEVARMLRLDPRARIVTLDVRVPPDLPAAEGVRDQLVQVFLNLSLNAMEAMPGGGMLTIAADATDGRVRVRFADTGHGLAPEARANLFRPFFTTKVEGSGLGLFLSRKIVCEHGGIIGASDREGGGTVFEVLLPQSREAPLALPRGA